MDLWRLLLAIATVSCLTSLVCGNLVFEVHNKFKGRGDRSLTAMRAHDARRHGRLLAAIDLQMGGNGHPSETGFLPGAFSPLSFQKLGETERPLAVRKRMFGRAWPLWLTLRDGAVPLWPQLAEKFHIACVNDEVATSWLNDDRVREAIHAAWINVSGPWELCTGRIKYHWNSGSMIPYHKNLTTQKYRALIFSGDHDMCVPFTGSQAWTQSLGYRILDEWRPWMSADQVAGFLQGYDHNLTFLTIKGAGHTVPEYKPREALDFYTRWLDGNPI